MNSYCQISYYKDKKWGITFSNEIKLGDINKINKYKWISFDPNTVINGEQYKSIAFDGIDKEYVTKIKEIFDCEFRENKDLSISEILDKLSQLFSSTKLKNDTKKYLGLLGEICFIYKCKEMDIDAWKFYQKNQKDTIDFGFPSFSFEIKLANKEKRSFKMSLKQLEALRNNPSTQLCALITDIDSIKGQNLEDIFEKCVEGHEIFNNDLISNVKNEIFNLKKYSEKLFDEIKINIEKSNFLIFEKELLPEIELKDNNTLINAVFEIFIKDNGDSLSDFMSGYKNELR